MSQVVTLWHLSCTKRIKDGTQAGWILFSGLLQWSLHLLHSVLSFLEHGQGLFLVHIQVPTVSGEKPLWVKGSMLQGTTRATEMLGGCGRCWQLQLSDGVMAERWCFPYEEMVPTLDIPFTMKGGLRTCKSLNDYFRYMGQSLHNDLTCLTEGSYNPEMKHWSSVRLMSLLITFILRQGE